MNGSGPALPPFEPAQVIAEAIQAEKEAEWFYTMAAAPGSGLLTSAGGLENGLAMVTVTAGTGRVGAHLSVVDNATGDPTFIAIAPQSPAGSSSRARTPGEKRAPVRFGYPGDGRAPMNQIPDPIADIRQMELADVAPTYELGRKLFTADRWPTLYRTWDEYEVVSLYANERDNCLVADRDGAVVGFALGSILEKRGEPWTYGYLLWLGVDPERTRRGLGRRLIEALMERFIAAGARMMLVDTEADNEAAVALFHRVGFDHERPHVYLRLNLTNHPTYRRLRGEDG